MIYLDNNATTKMDIEVLEAMIPYFTDNYGNPSNLLNAYGIDADLAVRKTQSILMHFFNAESVGDFIFTSGATESNNMVLRGIIDFCQEKNSHIITSCIEHASILNTCAELERRGVTCTYIPVEKFGCVNPNDIESSINERTVLISIMAANNEIGTIQPIEEIAEISHRHNIMFHTDMSQYIGTHSIDLKKTKIDMMSMSAHKIHGPKGIGVLYANGNARRKLSPIITGGGQQRGLRGGTLNVPAIVGLGKTIELIKRDQKMVIEKLTKLQTLFISMLGDNNVQINGSMENRIPNNISITFKNSSAIYLMSKLPELAFSTQSACSSGINNTSHVLKAIGLSKHQIDNTIRIGLSKYTTEEEVKTAVAQIQNALQY